MIKNNAVLNEELDPKLMVVKLKRDIEPIERRACIGYRTTEGGCIEGRRTCKVTEQVYLSLSAFSSEFC